MDFGMLHYINVSLNFDKKKAGINDPGVKIFLLYHGDSKYFTGSEI